jgi:hypothetical protein
MNKISTKTSNCLFLIIVADKKDRAKNITSDGNSHIALRNCVTVVVLSTNAFSKKLTANKNIGTIISKDNIQILSYSL